MSNFFAFLNRMKFINRWSLMRNNGSENIAEHTLQVAMIAHVLAVIKNKRFQGTVDPQKAASLAIYHECSECLTGDLPTPVKYFNTEIESAYKTIEAFAQQKLVAMLPEELRGEMQQYLIPDTTEQEYQIVKAADKLSALIKCMEETNGGNVEFKSARASIEQELSASPLPEVGYFMETFIGAFEKTLDEISLNGNSKL